jgi:heme exporter protein D
LAVDSLPMLDRHAPLEQQRENHRDHRLGEIERLPALLGKHPQQAVADVVVHAAHVGPGVMAVIVGFAPVVAGAGDVPLVGLAVEMRVAHPVVLAVHDVVAQLHVLENFRERQQQRADDQRRQRCGMRKTAEQPAADRAAPQQDAARKSAPAHAGDNGANVLGIALAQRCDGTRAHRVEFLSEAFEFVGAERAIVDMRRVDMSRHGVLKDPG